jgi:glycosyltransferase involved in cell wall biosynthesis
VTRIPRATCDVVPPRTDETTHGKSGVLYVGGFELPDGNAAAHRVIANAKLLRTLGYETAFLHYKAGASAALTSYAGFECHEFPEVPGGAALVRTLWDTATVESVIERRGDIGVLIAYNYPAIALARLRRYCRKHGILCLADVTEWYGSRDRSLAYKIVKGIDTLARMRVVHKHLDGLVVISSLLEDYYKGSVATVRIPPLYDLHDPRWRSTNESLRRSDTTLVYAGSPSSEKECLDALVAATLDVGQRHDVSLQIVGITQEQFSHMYRDSAAAGVLYTGLSQAERSAAVTFHGRVSHNAALEFVKRADYTVIVREPNRVNMAGFPTKFVESIACGTPVIANASSDLAYYLSAGENGHLVSLGSLAVDLDRILTQDVRVPVDRGLFDYHAYVEVMEEFMSTLPDRRRDGVSTA